VGRSDPVISPLPADADRLNMEDEERPIVRGVVRISGAGISIPGEGLDDMELGNAIAPLMDPPLLDPIVIWKARCKLLAVVGVEAEVDMESTLGARG
jgi:hypothetical protein